jgi:hypothetical protein
MAITTSLARWVMNLAAGTAPAARRDFAHGMREEFEALDFETPGADRLGWALGCLTTAAGWRLRADGLFLVALVAVGLTLDQIMFLPFFVLPGDLVHAIAYYYALAFPALVCGMLGAWRPGYAYAAALIVWLIREAQSAAIVIEMLDGDPLGRDWHVMDAPPIVGFSALLGWSFVGAAIGAYDGRRRITRGVAA